MTGEKGFLSGAYDLPNAGATEQFYNDWAASYDAEVAENGYATPRRSAQALAEAVEDTGAALLDIGCGTGLSGLAFSAAGFTTIDGTDLSQGMLDAAGARGLYRRLWLGDANRTLDVAPGTYAHAAAVGVINPGHAPPETVDAALAILPVGGCFVFSLNDHALADPAFAARPDALVASGRAEILFREHGPHLPGTGLESTVFVLRKR